jgi:hypothetical protein
VSIVNNLREYAELRKRFPFESIEERLPPNPPLPAGELMLAAQQNLTYIEDQLASRSGHK